MAAVGGAASRALRVRSPPRLTGAGAPSSLELELDEVGGAAKQAAKDKVTDVLTLGQLGENEHFRHRAGL